MKYFILMILSLLAISYKIASNNESELKNSTDSEEKETVIDIKKIDLSKIKIQPEVSVQNSAGGSSPSQLDDPQPDPADDSYAENYGEIQEELKDAKFRDEGKTKYSPEPAEDHEYWLREEIQKRKKH